MTFPTAPRRTPFRWIAQAAVAAASCLLASGPAQAADYPQHTVTVVNPWTTGGPADAVARPILKALSDHLKQSFILDNKPGANGVIGAAFVARAAPDGYTLLFSHVGPITISPALMKQMPFDPVNSLQPITQVVSAPLVLVVRPDLPIHNLKEFTQYAAAHPGKLSYGSVGPGSTTHLAGEMLANTAKVSLLHVPYKGAAPVMTDLLGKQIDFAFLNIAAVVPYAKDGRLRPIAVSTLKRSPLLPQLPAIAETYPGYEVNSWYGLMAPAGTPRVIVDLLHREVAEAIKSPEVAKSLAEMGLTPEATAPEVYAEQIRRDLARWKQIVEITGLEKQ
jgi:tripartite-type tricarboxylate transporter receptor subunit TctC